MLKVMAAVLALSVAAMVLFDGRAPRRAAEPLARAEAAGPAVPSTLRDREGRLLLAGLRVVEPGVLYRASAFPRNIDVRTPEGAHVRAAALLGPDVFFRFRALGIRRVLSLHPHLPDVFAEQGYFDFWARRTGYRIEVTWVEARPEKSYARTDDSGLHAGAVVIQAVRERRPGDGAVLVQGDSGKDAVGVAVGVYEAWRDRGWMARDDLWKAVRARYLLSNTLLPEAGPFAGRPSACASGERALVCPEWLDGLRGDVELLAQI